MQVRTIPAELNTRVRELCDIINELDRRKEYRYADAYKRAMDTIGDVIPFPEPIPDRVVPTMAGLYDTVIAAGRATLAYLPDTDDQPKGE